MNGMGTYLSGLYDQAHQRTQDLSVGDLAKMLGEYLKRGQGDDSPLAMPNTSGQSVNGGGGGAGGGGGMSGMGTALMKLMGSGSSAAGGAAASGAAAGGASILGSL